MERCASCGLELAASARVCGGCGASVRASGDAGHEDARSLDLPLDLPPDYPAPEHGHAGADAHPTAPVRTPPSGFTAREVLGAAAAVIAAGVLTFALLAMRGAENTAAASAPPASSPAAPSASASPAPSAFLHSWSTANVHRWRTGARTFAVELTAENRVAVWQRQVTPVLVVRCQARRPEVFVFTDSPARIEPRTDDHTVRLAFDGGPAAEERWTDSADHDALFAPDAAAFLARLAGARTLAFGFTPHNAAPAVAHFHVADLATHLEASRECGWQR